MPALVAAVAQAAPVAGADARPAPRAPPVEVVGRLRNVSVEDVELPDDVLGHGIFTAELRIQRVLRGTVPVRTVTVRYLAHTYLRDDRPVRLRLKPTARGRYDACAPREGEGFHCD